MTLILSIIKNKTIEFNTSTPCDNFCSFRGFCLVGKNYCKEGYAGNDCRILFSKVNCLNNCSSNGNCTIEGIYVFVIGIGIGLALIAL
jgi:hypothetical protein